MRILHIIHRYYPAVGGSEHFFRILGKYLRRRDHMVEVWTTDADEIEAFWQRGRHRFPAGRTTVEDIIVDRFPVRVYPQHCRVARLLSEVPFLRPIYHFPSPVAPRLFSRCKTSKEHFDLVHVTALPYTSLFYYGRCFCRRTGSAFVATPFMHLGQKQDDEVARFYTRPDQMELIASANLVFVQTPSEKKFLKQQGVEENRLCLLGMGISPSDFPEEDWAERSARFRKDYNLSGPIIFNLTAQSEDKGSLFLINAAASLWEQGVDFDLVLAGSRTPGFDEKFEQLPAGIRNRCRVMGRISEEEKKDLLAAGDLFVHPTRTDSFGIAFLEAWWHKKPVIAARAGGVPDVVREDEDGLLVEFGDTEALAGSIRLLLENPEKRSSFGQSGHDKVAEFFTWDTKCAIVLDALERVAPKPKIQQAVIKVG
jgi:glycosyltransferase involved in cell wall biosynthesis